MRPLRRVAAWVPSRAVLRFAVSVDREVALAGQVVRNQHTVPRSYLRHFADAETGRVWCWDKARDEVVERSPDRLTCIPYFYTLVTDGPVTVEDQWLEEFLGTTVENDVGMWLSERPWRADSAFKFGVGLRRAVSWWVAFQILRTPLGQAMVADGITADARSRLEAWANGDRVPMLRMLSMLGENLHDPHLVAKVDKQAVELLNDRVPALLRPPSKNAAIIHTAAIVAGFGIYPSLADTLSATYQWELVRVDRSAAGLLASDSPVTFAGYDLHTPLWTGVPETIYWPVQPDFLVVMHAHNFPDKADEVVAARALNEQTATWATRWVIGCSEHQIRATRDAFRADPWKHRPSTRHAPRTS